MCPEFLPPDRSKSASYKAKMKQIYNLVNRSPNKEFYFDDVWKKLDVSPQYAVTLINSALRERPDLYLDSTEGKHILCIEKKEKVKK